MKVILADGAGFCFGVRRAVQGALDAAKAGRVACLGEITHNRRVIENLQRAGVRVIERINEAQPGETIIIRAHGEGRAVYDALAAQNIDFIDLTCPMVAENRRRAIDAQKSAKIIIFGDKNHPEVLGILGWLDNGAIVISETNNFVDLDKKDKYFLIAQTTASAEDFNEFIHNISQIIPNLEIAGGICPETKTKQSTAKALAKTVDKMLIFGDLASSNSKKLYETCHKIQKKSYLFQTIDEIDLKSFCKGDIIGITAGASTPPDILEEAMIIMTELEKNVNGENIGETPEIAKSPPKTAAAPAPDEPENGESFEELLNESILTLHTGDIVKGTVISINNGEIMVNLGYKSDGIIQRGHYSDKTDADPAEELSPGDEIEVYVLRVNDGDGNVLLSKKRIDAQKGQLEIEKAYKEGTPLPGKITEVVNRGVIVMIKGIRAFVPNSQVSNRFVRNLETVLGHEYNFSILEFDRGKRRIVAGRKDLATKEENENREKAMEGLEVGKKVTGIVSRTANFGAFVGLGGVDGLIHISELSWARIRRVEDVVKEGDEVTAWIIRLDKEAGKVSLSMKDVEADPWYNIEMKYPVGAITTGRVVRLANFGAFVELEEGLDGLVHISQISHKRIEKPDEALTVGETVEVKITGTNIDKKRISLSIKETQGGMMTDVAYDDEYDDEEYEYEDEEYEYEEEEEVKE